MKLEEINWRELYNLRDIAERDLDVKKQYESKLRELVSSNILSLNKENNHWVMPVGRPRVSLNLSLEGKILYFVRMEDAEKAKKGFTNSTVISYGVSY